MSEWLMTYKRSSDEKYWTGVFHFAFSEPTSTEIISIIGKQGVVMFMQKLHSDEDERW